MRVIEVRFDPAKEISVELRVEKITASPVRGLKSSVMSPTP